MSAKGRLFVIPSTLGAVPAKLMLPRRTVDVARALVHFVAETPKVARRFLKELDPALSLHSIDIVELSEHTPRTRVAALLAPALAGNDVGLLADAGCPGIADPGALLIAAAHRAGVQVVPLPGSSAVTLALMASGLSGQSFAFRGYLPVKPTAREASIKSLDDTVARTGATQIFIEAPYRNESLFEAVVATCRPSTMFCVAVDLTLDSEEVISRTISAWREAPRRLLAKRPAIFLLGKAPEGKFLGDRES